MSIMPVTYTPGEIDFDEDVTDLRDVVARFEYLEGSIKDAMDSEQDPDDDELQERERIWKVMEEFHAQCGGGSNGILEFFQKCAENEPTLIAESYFIDYAKEYAEETSDASLSDAAWPFNHIDWEAAADEIKVDYTEITLDESNFLYRMPN